MAMYGDVCDIHRAMYVDVCSQIRCMAMYDDVVVDYIHRTHIVHTSPYIAIHRVIHRERCMAMYGDVWRFIAMYVHSMYGDVWRCML